MHGPEGGLLGTDIGGDCIVRVEAPTGHEDERGRQADDRFKLGQVLAEHQVEKALPGLVVEPIHAGFPLLRTGFEYATA